MKHWAEKYIGTPWVLGETDCWNFFRMVMRTHYHILTPDINMEDYSPSKAPSIFKATWNGEEQHRENWQKVEPEEGETLRDGDAVLMRVGQHPCHIGIWLQDKDPNLEPGILHSIEGSGVCFTTLERLRMLRWNVDSYWRHISRDER